MKKQYNSFTPPPKNSDNLTFCTSFKKFIHILSVSSCLALVSSSFVFASSTGETSTDVQQITSFGNYEWCTSCEEIKTSEITSNMKENIDYAEDAVYDLTALGFYHKEIAGYDTQVSYIFSEDGLSAGIYVMDGEDEEIFEDLLAKFTSKYGDPYINKESTGWGRIAVWVDENKNAICTSEMLDTIYFKNETPFAEYYNEFFIKFHELDLLQELNKYNNTDGL